MFFKLIFVVFFLISFSLPLLAKTKFPDSLKPNNSSKALLPRSEADLESRTNGLYLPIGDAQVVESDNRLPSQISETGISKKVIAIDSENETKLTVAEVLREETGLEIFNQGGLGKVTNVFLRGGNSEHTLVLIDGVEVNDPLSPTRAFDFSSINLDDVERIEVIKGPQSVLYGSDGLSGIINIISKKGDRSKKTYAEIQGGTYNTKKATIGTNGEVSIGKSKTGPADFTKSIKYLISASRTTTDGFSSANENDGNPEEDGHQQITATGNFVFNLSRNSKISSFTKFNEGKTDLDAFGGPSGDDPNFNSETTQASTKLQFDHSSFKSKLSSTAAIHYSLTDRNTFDDPFFGDQTFKGRNFKTELLNHYRFSRKNISSLGLEFDEEEGESDTIAKTTVNTRAIFLQHQFNVKKFSVTLGGRVDEHTQIDQPVATYRAASAYRFSGVRLFGSIGSGFKTPSLFQLFDPTFGNPELEAEEVVSWDAGLSSDFHQKNGSFSVTYFNNDYSNLISFDPTTFQSVNLGESIIRGVESEVSWKFLSVKHTHLFEFENQGNTLIRRPRNSWSIKASQNFGEQLKISGVLRFVGERLDFDASTFGQIQMPNYEVFNLSANYKYSPALNIFTRIENLFDKDYEEIDGFGTAGLSVFAGLKYTYF